jgi:hypothetical protein
VSAAKVGDLLHFGKAVCLVDLVACEPTRQRSARFTAEEMVFGDYGPGRYAWVTENLRVFEPFDVTGKQGLFECYCPPFMDGYIKAVSLWEPWASLMRTGAKTIETRSWFTSYRGPLLICAAKKKDPASLALLEDPVFRAGLMRAVPRG